MTTHPDNINTGRLTLTMTPGDAGRACKLSALRIMELATELGELAAQLDGIGDRGCGEGQYRHASVPEWWEICQGIGTLNYEGIDDVSIGIRQVLDFLGAFMSPEAWYDDNPDQVGPTKARLERERLSIVGKPPPSDPYNEVVTYTGERWLAGQEAIDHVARVKAEASPCQHCGTTGTCNCKAWAGGRDGDRTD